MDNLVKFVLDSLNKRAYLYDSQIALLSTAKLYANPHLAEAEVEVADEVPVKATEKSTSASSISSANSRSNNRQHRQHGARIEVKIRRLGDGDAMFAENFAAVSTSTAAGLC